MAAGKTTRRLQRSLFSASAFIFLWALVLSVVSLPLYAQNASGALSGFVTDARTGEALAGATVLVEGTEKGDAADKNGYFRVANIVPGTYTVRVSFVGYRTQKEYNVVVQSGSNSELNFRLQPAVSRLDEITVAPDPFENPPENPLSRQELSRVQIASYPGGNNDIAKVVQSLPGVSGSVGGFRNDVIIRGGAPSENVYYLDGIEIPVINHFATQGSAGGPVGLLNVSFFEGVELSTSSFPARYGNVLSGVLQFDQRNGNARNMGANFRLGASEAALTVEGPLFKEDDREYAKTTFIASVRRSYLQLLFRLIDLPFLPDYWDYQYKINHRVDAFNEITITGVGSVDDFMINKPDDITAEQQAILDQVPIIKQTSSTGGISWRKRFKNSDANLFTSLSTSVFNNDFRRYSDNENKQGLLQRNKSREWRSSLRSRYQHFVGTWSFSAGLEAEHTDYRNSTFRSLNNISFNTDLRFLQYGLFGQVTNEWLDGRFSTSLGIRADANTFLNSNNNMWDTVSPRLALSYDLDTEAHWQVQASVGRYYKIPPATILGFKTGGGFTNRDARYIQSDHLVAGFTYKPRSATKFSIEGFYKRYDDYPVSVTDSVSLANLGADFEVFGNEQIQSAGKGRAYGVEFSFQQKLQQKFYGILAYTLYLSEFTGFDTDTYLPSLWDNRHLLTFTGGYKLGNNWELGARLRILGGAPYAPLDRQASEQSYPTLVFDYSELGSRRLDAFNSLDLRLDKRWSFNRWSLDVYVEVANVLGNSLPSPPRYGLSRDSDGNAVVPNEIIQIEAADNSSVLPTLGIVVDI